MAGRGKLGAATPEPSGSTWIGCYSAEFYGYLDGRDQGEGKRRALFISWAKYADKWVNDLAEEQLSQVAQVKHQIQEPEEIRYLETERTMSKYGKIRAIVIQSGDNKQRPAIYTNGTQKEIGTERVVQLICGRWGEANAIKELLHQHLIHYTPGYYVEKLETQPMVTNPAITKLKHKRAGLVSELNRLKVELANQVLKERDKKRKRRAPTRSRADVLADITVTESTILLTDHLEAIQGSGDRLCGPASVRRPQRHVTRDVGQVPFSNQIPGPVARSAEIFLKIAKRWSFAQTSMLMTL